MTIFICRMILSSLHRRFRRNGVTFLAVMFAVAALVVLTSIMSGVGDAMINNSVAIRTGHVFASFKNISDESRLSITSLPNCRPLFRKVLDGSIGKGGVTLNAVIFGVEPAGEARESAVPQKIIDGAFLPEQGQVVISRSLADELGVSVGEEISLLHIGAESANFEVGGIFKTGLEHLDKRSVFVNAAGIAGAFNELAVFTNTPARADEIKDAVKNILPQDASVKTWREALPELVQLIELNRISMSIVLVLAVAILAFGISNTAFISVSERSREFGILKAMGFRGSEVTAIFLGEILILVLAAGIIGSLFGAAVSEALAETGIDLSRWTSENQHFLVSGIIFPRNTFVGVIAPCVIAVICGFVAGALPAWRAARINVVEALRWL